MRCPSSHRSSTGRGRQRWRPVVPHLPVSTPIPGDSVQGVEGRSPGAPASALIPSHPLGLAFSSCFMEPKSTAQRLCWRHTAPTQGWRLQSRPTK